MRLFSALINITADTLCYFFIHSFVPFYLFSVSSRSLSRPCCFVTVGSSKLNRQSSVIKRGYHFASLISTPYEITIYIPDVFHVLSR